MCRQGQINDQEKKKKVMQDYEKDAKGCVNLQLFSYAFFKRSITKTIIFSILKDKDKKILELRQNI